MVSIAAETLGPEHLGHGLNVGVIFRQHHSSPSKRYTTEVCRFDAMFAKRENHSFHQSIAFSSFMWSTHRPPMLGTVLRASIALIVSNKDGVCDIVSDYRPLKHVTHPDSAARCCQRRRRRPHAVHPAPLFGRDERISLNCRDRNWIWILLMILQVPRALPPTPLSGGAGAAPSMQK
jgi:hypothetical protein